MRRRFVIRDARCGHTKKCPALCLKHAGTTSGQWPRCTKADRRPVSNYQGTCQASSNIDYAVMLYKLQIGHFVPHSDGPP